jgi:hypothetical protein
MIEGIEGHSHLVIYNNNKIKIPEMSSTCTQQTHYAALSTIDKYQPKNYRSVGPMTLRNRAGILPQTL